ncbi:glycosyltransferase [Shewanella sp. SP1S1-7]|uniref:glycosyltransferase n=1 Tax=Shewanella sp. SP1S1-7 TaxID=3063536 RepID=UPI00289132C7|nr:glycosyltransferase [Shewanella sp. SP1S1-7]MDT3336846.1 glycosyltransferase [Shewanella sp. SP1S1-7]
MRKMLILSGLFFNKKGNQSFLNSVKGYNKEYDVTLITAATMNSDVYISKERANEFIPNLKIVSVINPKVIDLGKKIIGFLRNNRKNSTSEVNSNPTPKVDGIINLPSTKSSYISFYFRSCLILVYSFFYYLKNKPDIVCCYEINAVRASFLLKKVFGAKVFIKLQGTALGASLDKLEDEAVKKTFAIDILELKKGNVFDGAIMTNDGTLGDKVLQYYGYISDKILFINNGIEPRFTFPKVTSEVIEKRKSENLKDRINFVVVSRLTSWKRIDLVLDCVAKMKEVDSRDISLTLIGVGSESEYQYYHSLIKKLGIEDSVQFIHGAPTEDVVDYILKSDFLLSLNKYTNVSNPVFESLYLSTPVITIEQPDLVSVIGPGESGCIFLPNSTNEEILEAFVNEISKMNYPQYTTLLNYYESYIEHFPTWEKRSNFELEFLNDKVLS